MRLVEIDAVGLEALQRILDGLRDVFAREPLLAAGHLHADLGGEHELLAPSAAQRDPVADDGLRFAARIAGRPLRIDVGRIHQVEAVPGERVEQPERGRLVHRPAEHVPSEGERRDFDPGAAQGTQLHAERRGGSTNRPDW
jgi:hypothetical protein